MNININNAADLSTISQRSGVAKIKQSELAAKIANAAGVDALIATSAPAARCGTPTAESCDQLAKITGAWGQGGSPYDVDGSGKVDVADLVSLVSGWAQDASAAELASSQAATEGDGSTLASSSQTLESIQNIAQVVANWGQPGTSYDLNGDGTVNVQDLFQAIAMLNQQLAGAATNPEQTTVTGAKPAENSVDPATVPPDAPVAAPITEGPHAVTSVGQLVAQWGQSGTNMDLNGDGLVNAADLLQLIAQIQGGSTSNAPNATAPAANADLAGAKVADATTSNKLERTNEPLSKARLHRLSKAFMERLSAAGYGDVPPTNIRDLLAKLNLTPTDSKRLLAQLAEQYPNGLGVNLKA